MSRMDRLGTIKKRVNLFPLSGAASISPFESYIWPRVLGHVRHLANPPDKNYARPIFLFPARCTERPQAPPTVPPGTRAHSLAANTPQGRQGSALIALLRAHA